MHRSSLVRRPLGLLLGLALLASTQLNSARAEDKKFVKVSIDTVDGVKLKGTFYKSPKGKDEPTVLLLHKLGPGNDSHKDGWDKLAATLNEKGYSVLSFDFRGHGDSTEVDPTKFWSAKFPWNTNGADVKGGDKELAAVINMGRPRESISVKDFSPRYSSFLINDIAAAKLWLDDRNDGGECNSRALIVIGAEDGAALGAIWMASEWSRYGAARVFLNPRGPRYPVLDFGGKAEDPEGKDEYCAIWLSMTPSLGARKLSVSSALRPALGFAANKKKLPMGFLYGDSDDTGKTHAREFVSLIKGNVEPKDDKIPYTLQKAITNTKLAGSALLRPELGTEDMIVRYLDNLGDKFKKTPAKWSKVDLDRTLYIWGFPGVRGYYLAKDEKAKVLEPIPLDQLGITYP